MDVALLGLGVKGRRGSLTVSMYSPFGAALRAAGLDIMLLQASKGLSKRMI
jgi:hypothetical protein